MKYTDEEYTKTTMENLNAGNELWSFTEGKRIKGEEDDNDQSKM